MTTPDDSAKAGRVRRPKLARPGPNRSSTPAAPATDPGPPPAVDADGAPHEAPISEAVAQAVQLGYAVISKNIEQGRVAAEQFRAGQYNVRDVPYDLNQMTLRLLNLTREVSTTAYDIFERLLRDPNFPGATPRPGAQAGGQTAADPRRGFTPPSFHPAPPAPGVAPGPATTTSPAPPKPAPPTAAPPGAEGVRLDVSFGARPGVVRAASLSRPSTPTPLALPALVALDAALAPIRGVTFTASPDGQGVTARIDIAPDQPAGIYSGVICALDSQVALGSLTIEVMA